MSEAPAIARVANVGHRAFRDALVTAGILCPSRAKGVYGKGSSFVSVFDAVDRFVTEAGATETPEVYRFPSVLSLADLVRTGYPRSFPALVGAVHAFDGGLAAHEALLRADSGDDWTAALDPTDLALVPAACYPVYPMLTGELPAGGRVFDVLGTCFRREPSDDPARMQEFHQHEFVHVGTPESTRAFRDRWLVRAQDMMSDLGLHAVATIANDPFFGRAASMLAASQRENGLKYELQATVSSGVEPTAIVSCNCHLDNLTAPFAIRSAGGGVADSACVGFGIERIALALFATHGLERERWPVGVQNRLWD